MWFVKKSRVSFLKLFFGILCVSQASFSGSMSFQSGSTIFGGIYSGVEDTYLRQAYPDASCGKWGELNLGSESYSSGSNQRALIRYDISSLLQGWQTSVLGSATTITSARLKLFFAVCSGNSFTNKIVKLYRISSANKNWAAGSSASRSVSEIGASCWNHRLFDSRSTDAGDPVCSGCHRDIPWASDSKRWNPSTGRFAGSDTLAHGCGVSGIDYFATEVGSVYVSSSQVNSMITIPISDMAFLKSWVLDHTKNEGFLITCPELENGSMAFFSSMRFASSENTTISNRPALELDVNNFNIPPVLPPPVAIRDSIHADTAYQSGVLTLSHYSPNDKIWFSNGITISLYAQDPGVCGALGRSDVFGGIAVDSCDSLVDAGFRYVQTGEWQMDRAVDIYANNDTDWVNTGTFPDTLEELDSLYGNGVAGGSKAGKWLFSYDFAPQQDFTQVYHASKNIKTLFYIQSKTNKLKLRVSNILFNYSGTQIDSIKLLWAVDSLGNGKFMMPTSIKSKPTIRFASKSSSSNQYRKSILGYGFGARNQNLQNVAMYNLKGELIKGNMQRRTNQVVIYKQ